jgi:D-sedoheptulose 7-phosphate isomerase
MCERREIEDYLDEAATAVRGIDRNSLSVIARICIDAVRSGGTLFFCGNGGSAVDAQHLACELVGRFRLERPGIAAIALSSSTAVITAIANDYGFEKVFSRQVEALGRKGDVLVAISTSGESPNVLEAAAAASRMGMKVVSLTGSASSQLAALSDGTFVTPSGSTSHSQEAILIAGHSICCAVEKACSGGGGGAC